MAKTIDRTELFGAREGSHGIIRCDACPVLCRIRPGRAGACTRYANEDGRLIRTDPLVLSERIAHGGGDMVPFLEAELDWNGNPVAGPDMFVTGIGAGTTYPDYKPAPFVVSSQFEGVDTVTIVSEAIFSYCGVKVKIDTDRHIGDETAAIHAKGLHVGHITTAEYGSQMLSLGGVRHLTGGAKKEGVVTCETLMALCNKEAVELQIEDGSKLIIEAGRPPIIDGIEERRMRVGCGSAAIGIFAQQWFGHADEVIVLDDHITGVLSEHQAGKVLGMKPTGIRIRGRKSTAGRYFQVAAPGHGWGGTDITDPLSIIETFDARIAWPGMRLLMTSTTGEDSLYCELDETLTPVEMAMPDPLAQVVERIGENCEPSLATVMFMAGAGGSLRAGVTDNPVKLTRSVRERMTRVTLGGAPAYVWPGGGITVMVDVTRMPDRAFGYVPTPAIVAPIEFTLPRNDFADLGGHIGAITPLSDIVAEFKDSARHETQRNPWPLRKQVTE